MGTVKQRIVARRVAKAINDGEQITGAQILADANYSLEVQKKPGTILNSPGVKEELDKLGFSEENARMVVGQILSDDTVRPEPRLKAAELVFKVHGSFAPEKHENKNLNVNVEVGGIDLQKLADETAAKLREQKT